jgi:hypothetical protein
MFPRDIGYRNMVDCDAGGKQNLYVATFGVGGRILYTPDGTNFPQASLLGLDLVNDLGYRAMACWRGRLWISPSGTFSISPSGGAISFNADIAFRAVLLVNTDPSSSSSPWEQVLDVVNDPQLGNAGNTGIWSMAVFGDTLYLGVSNETTGFELWKADGARCQRPPGPCELSWEKLIVNGGGRPLGADGTPNNARVFDFAEFNGDLYWGASESASIKQFATPELLRIGPDDRWDLIVGEPRDASAMAADPNFNCQLEGSSCVPLSGLGPGFGPTPLTPGRAIYIWTLAAHEGTFYAGTAEAPMAGFMVTPGPGVGFDLWRSSNGTDWSLVSDNGFGNPFNYGARNMTSTPLGLFVGTANPFTLEDGTHGGTGGAEVWLGIDGQE